MIGEYQHSLDSKGRVFIPAKLREELGDVFYITLSMEKCLSLYKEDSWNTFCDRVNQMPYVKQRKMRPLFAYASRCELDGQGRVLIPQVLRDYAGLIRNVTVLGCNNHAEIWDCEQWSTVCKAELSPDNIAAVMEELEF